MTRSLSHQLERPVIRSLLLISRYMAQSLCPVHRYLLLTRITIVSCSFTNKLLNKDTRVTISMMSLIRDNYINF